MCPFWVTLGVLSEKVRCPFYEILMCSHLILINLSLGVQKRTPKFKKDTKRTPRVIYSTEPKTVYSIGC
jgi:hypothetical protein